MQHREYVCEVRIARNHSGTMPYRATLSTTGWVGATNACVERRGRETRRDEGGLRREREKERESSETRTEGNRG